MISSDKISICICTFNRSEKLYRILENIVVNEVFSNYPDVELLIIDNNSTDDTEVIINSFIDKLPIRYLFEKEQGLSHARNCALNNFTGDWLIFTDDDVLLDSSWLSEYKYAINNFPEARYFGGKIKPYWNVRKPTWLKDENLALLSGVYGHYDLGEQNFLYQRHHEMPYGGNFAVSKQLVETVGEFNVDLGVKGRNSGRGEETQYFQRATDAGFQGAYVAKAVCLHEVDTSRFCTKYMFKHGIQKGLAHAITDSNLLSKVSLTREIMFILESVLQLLKGRRDRYYQCIINLGLLRGLRKVKVNKE